MQIVPSNETCLHFLSALPLYSPDSGVDYVRLISVPSYNKTAVVFRTTQSGHNLSQLRHHE